MDINGDPDDKLQTLRNANNDKIVEKRLRPLADQAIALLLELLNGNNKDNTTTNSQYLQGLKYLPQDVKEKIFNCMTAGEKGKHYRQFLDSSCSLVEAGKWVIPEPDEFVQGLCEFQNLQVLKLSCFSMQKITRESLVNMLNTTPLIALSLKDPIGLGISNEVFIGIIENSKNLRKLSVSSQKMNDECLRGLEHVSLTALTLHCCHLMSARGLQYIEKCATLRKLHLYQTQKLQKEEVADFCGKSGGGCTQLTALTLRGIPLATYSMSLPNLVSLVLSDGGTRHPDVQSFELNCPKLETLRLAIPFISMATVANEIGKLAELKELKLTMNDYSNLDFTSVVHAMRSHSKLSILSVSTPSGFIAPSTLTTLTSSLTKVRLNNVLEVDDAVMQYLTNTLVNLSDLALSNAGLVEPIISFKHLEWLDVSKNTEMKRLVLNCPSLKSLDISESTNLFTVDWKCPDLEAIWTAATMLADDVVIDLTQKCSVLKKLAMPRMPNVTDTIVTSICDNLKDLKYINIGGCTQLTPNFSFQILTCFPTIRFIHYG